MAAADRQGAPPLAGRHIVVTRPAGQAGTLAAAIQAQGGTAVLFPVLEIFDVADLRPLVAVADRLEQYDFAVFISANAVDKALNVVLARRPWPVHLRAVTVGKSSERELARFGVGEVIAPSGRFDSEALLSLPEMAQPQVAGKRFVIFRGDGGRELLGDTLVARGASIEYVECYRRGKPNLDAAPLMKLWARGELDAITVTSSEGLRNLFDMVGKLGQAWLRRTSVFVPHERIAEEARRLGLERVVLTGAGDDGLLAGLLAHYGDNKKQ
ncbi:MAG: uroporphyrinogen-III synthase [Pseudomonadota bacterium]|jgi:uroporphyrinogen-III synthase